MAAEFWSVLGLGFILGLRHALEPDHVIAVSTVATRSKSFVKSAGAGIYWGIGHTLTLFVIGMILFPLKQTIPDSIGIALEGFVAVVIILLGVRTLQYFKGSNKGKEIRSKSISFLIGTVHGLAGSGAFVLLAMAKVDLVREAAVFILIFGLGTILGMLVFAVLISSPFILLSKNNEGSVRIIGMIAGVSSMAFGLFYLYEIGIFSLLK